METIPNSSHNYQSLTPRKFEELLYDIFNKKILFDSNIFDKVDLKEEGADQGIDVDLYRDGLKVGGIQCKLHKNKITKTAACKEILKFCLFYLIDAQSFPYSAEFDYYFACINGFSKDTPEFLINFKNRIVTEYKLEEWTNSLIKKYPTISNKFTSYSSIESNLKLLLSNIKVTLIKKEDLDTYLAQFHSQDLISKYWQVRTILTNSPASLSLTDIRKNFKAASSPIFEIKNTFSTISNPHITRSETINILNWINKDLINENNNICLVVGNAGAGKSAIIKDVYDSLVAKKIPVLGIKSDIYSPKSISDLESYLNLQESIENQLIQITDNVNTPRAVLLIDQLDALSQAQSNKREPLNTFRGLISKVRHIPKLRVIIAIRAFDLQEDSDLSHLNEKAMKVLVGELSLEEVEKVLSNTPVTFNQLSSTVKGLLRVPQNLDMFCRIADSDLNWNQLTTRQAIQNELFVYKVINYRKGRKRLKKRRDCIYLIAEEMYKQGGYTPLSVQKFKVKYTEELDYLISENILSQRDSKIHFFHQSFYEFVFAKSFVVREKDLFEFIKSHRQSIRVRGIVKMVIDFLREENPKEYHKQLEKIITSNEIAFHFKHLLISNFGYITGVTLKEKIFLTRTILPHQLFKKIFLESVSSYSWFESLVEDDIFNKLLNPTTHLYQNKDTDIKVCSNILSKFLVIENYTVLEYAQTSLLKNEAKDEVITSLLLYSKDWSNNISCNLFDLYISEETLNDTWYCEILKNAFQDQVSWCFNKLERLLLSTSKCKNNHGSSQALHWDYSIRTTLEFFFDTQPVDTLRWSIDFIHRVALKYRIGLMSDSIFEQENGFSHFLSDDIEGSEHDETFYGIVVKRIPLVAEYNPAIFKEIFTQYIDNQFFIIHRLFVKGLLMIPEKYPTECFLLIRSFSQKKGFNLEDDYTYWLRELIRKCYSYLDFACQRAINKMILGVKEDNWYLKIHINDGKRVHYLNYFGKKQLLFIEAIPSNEIKRHEELCKRHQELLRKHTKPKNNPPIVNVVGSIPAPYEASAYKKMSLSSWEKTFLLINIDRFMPSGRRGSIEQHARAFEEEVCKRSQYFYPLIEKMVKEWTAHERYIIAGLRGLSSSNYDPINQCKLVLFCLEKGQTNYIISTLIDIIDMLIQSGVNNTKIIDYLCMCCKQNSREEMLCESDLLLSSINTIEGKALSTLMNCAPLSESYPQIKTTIYQIVEGRNLMLHITVMTQLIYWLRIDILWTKNIFLRLIEYPNLEVYKYGVKVANYLNNYNFEEMLPYYEKSKTIPEVLPFMANILFQSWARGNDDAFPIFLDMANSNEVKVELISISSTFMKEAPQFTERVLKVYSLFVEEQSNEISQAYNISFIKLPRENFAKFIPFLKKYAQNFKVASEYYYDYLSAGLNLYPTDCLELLSYFHNDKPGKIDRRQFYHKEKVMQLLLSIWSIWIENDDDDDNPHLVKTINIFDKILMNDEYRAYAHREILKSDS